MSEDQTKPISGVLDVLVEHIRQVVDEQSTIQARDELREGIIRALQADAEGALLARISRRIRAAFPTAALLRARGEWNEDMLLRLYPHQLLDAQGASLGRADDPSDAWAQVFDDDELYDDLVELAEGDASLEGDSEIPLT